MKTRQITKDEKVLMVKSILLNKEFIVFQHEEEALSMMYWKYSTNTDITIDELKDDITFLDKMN